MAAYLQDVRAGQGLAGRDNDGGIDGLHRGHRAKNAPWRRHQGGPPAGGWRYLHISRRDCLLGAASIIIICQIDNSLLQQEHKADCKIQAFEVSLYELEPSRAVLS